ncbi:MAG TPA: CIA30 family protein [Candidatus Kapabacteria bacterium]|nr:CIA30 family protein [Candidatus Kapabacteria bacterium]
MFKRIASLLLAAAACCGAELHAQDLLLKNAWLVDPVRRTVERGSIVVHNDMIDRVLAVAPEEFDGRVIDLAGKWVMPALHDMHVHSFGNLAPGNQMQMLGTGEVAKVMLYCGVGAFLDLFSPEDPIFALRNEQRERGLPGADIYCAGPILTCPGGHGTEYGMPTRTMSTPAEARSQVTELAAKHPDVVKIVYDHAAGWMPTIDQATMAAAVKTAGEHGIKTVIHIGTWKDAREAIEAGATCITHCYLNEVIPDDLVKLMHDRGVYEIPTMAVQCDFQAIMNDPHLLDRPLLRSVASYDVLSAYRDTTGWDARSRGWWAMQKRTVANTFASVKKMQEGGVKLMSGTDVGNLATFQGYSVHRELELMVACGMTPWEAITSTTTMAGEFLGRPVGIAPKLPADLLVLDASPVENIANTQRIVTVIQHGRLINREELIHPPATPWTVALIDDFSARDLKSSAGPRWEVNNDSAWGGSSTLGTEWKQGTLRVHGKLVTRKGAPALAGISLAFDSLGTPFDVTRFKGVRVRVRCAKGPLALKLMTTGVKNYDFHASMIPVGPSIKQIDIPFSEFHQIWSSPVPWTGRDMRGIAFWASDISNGDFDFTIDSIAFYP